MLALSRLQIYLHPVCFWNHEYGLHLLIIFCIMLIPGFLGAYIWEAVLLSSLSYMSSFSDFFLSTCSSVVPNKQIISILSRSFDVLYNAIKSPLSLLFSRVGSVSLESLYSYSKYLRLGAIFVAALCVLSSFFISLFLCGNHITAIYSNFFGIKLHFPKLTLFINLI